MAPFNFSVSYAARKLNPDNPIKLIVQLAHCPRPTAKAWYTGHRRPPVWFLWRLHDVVRDRKLWGLAGQLAYYISQREREPKHAKGFMLINPLTGIDKRNRCGRPKKFGRRLSM
jgi:hypothetical protein